MNDARPDRLTWRHQVLMAVLVAGAAILLWRLVTIQVLEHDNYRQQAALLHYGAAAVPAPRGAILEANGYPVATSIDTWDIYLDRFLWRDRERAAVAAVRLSDVLLRDMNSERIFATSVSASHETRFDAQTIYRLGTEVRQGDVLLLRDLEYMRGLAVDRAGLFGVRIVPSSVRIYPEGDVANQLIGHVGRDGSGLWGVESDYDHVLRGRAGIISAERDLLGRPIAFGERQQLPPQAGGEVKLTIDRFVQRTVEQALARALEEYESPSGSILIMNPHTGAVLALASLPTVRLSQGDLNDPALHDLVRARTVTDLYEPGSVLKTLTTAAAIDLGSVTAQSTYVDKGSVDIGEYTIRNWDLQAYGEVTVTEYLQRSLNTGAVWLSHRIGAHAFYDYLQAFGLGESTHIGLAGEADGLLRMPEDGDWSPVDLATNAYGQGLATTPLQVLTAVNAFANGGMLMRPYVVSDIVTATEARHFEPVEVRRVVSPQTARVMARLMFDVVESVPYHGARVEGYHVAGKTGTTLVSIPTGYDPDTTIASFVGFLPYEQPCISILIKIDEPQGSRVLGGEVAAPLFAEIATKLMDYLNVPRTDALVAAP